MPRQEREIVPRPKEGEDKQAYISRFMASEEARRDYPDQDQRAAVAYSLWEHRNMLENATEWPRLMKGRHLEVGVVRYNDIKNPRTGMQGATLLLTKDALDKMRNTFVGKPVVNEDHKEVNPNWFKEGKADGIVVDGYFDGADAWEHVNFLVWDDATRKSCRNGYQLSCAYLPKVDWTPGLSHNVPYDGVITDGMYTHLAVVPKPRYEGASILANSLGGPMKALSLFFKKNGVDNKVPLDLKTEVDCDGSKIPLAELVNAYAAEKAAKANVSAIDNALDNDSMIDMDGEQMPLSKLKDSYRNAMARKNAEDEEKKKKEKDDKDKDEAKNAADKAAKDAAAKIETDKKVLEAKNAADAQAKKDIEAKAAKEIQDAQSKKGSEFFNKLDEAANGRGRAVDAFRLFTMEDKVRRGAELYGSPKAEPAAKA